VSHHLAASKAMDRVIGVAALSPTAEKLRRLMHYGQMLQSHALHFFHLCSPDLLFGFGAETAKRNVVAVVNQYPDIAMQGIKLRKYGQEVIRVTAGKRVHGTGSIPGGINKLLTPEERDMLLADADQMIEWAKGAVQLIKQLAESDPVRFEQFGRFESKMMSLVRSDGGLDFYDGVLRGRDPEGNVLFDGIPDQNYHDLIREQVKSWSYMKFPYLKSMGPGEGWYKVGPLSRVQNCDFIPSPVAEAERQAFVAAQDGKICHSPLAYHWARMIEMLHAAEEIERLLADPDVMAGELVHTGTWTGEGVGIIEAPRGTLIHHYQVGEDDLVTMCNLIVSTTHNNQAMNEAVRQVARQYLNGVTITEGLLNHIEVAIRAFDPCLSCATHALGKMPLAVELVSPDGRTVDRLVKNG
jgi:NAD-reducing hydrogenase large subunit